MTCSHEYNTQTERQTDRDRERQTDRNRDRNREAPRYRQNLADLPKNQISELGSETAFLVLDLIPLIIYPSHNYKSLEFSSVTLKLSPSTNCFQRQLPVYISQTISSLQRLSR